MPKEKRKQLQPAGEGTVREKRARRQAGYYASLLSGKSPGKTKKRKNTHTNSHDHITQTSQAGRDGPAISPPPEVETEIFTPIVEGCIAPRTCLSCPPEDPSRQAKSSAGRAIPDTGFEVQVLAGEQEQRDKRAPRVTAVVKDEVAPSSVVLAQRLPGSQPSSAQVGEEDRRVTITGSMAQVLQVLQILTQMKNKKDMAVHAGELSHSRETIVEKDADNKAVYLDHNGTEQAVVIHMPPSNPTPAVLTHAAAAEFSENSNPIKPKRDQETLNSPTKLVVSRQNECLNRSGQSETPVEQATHTERNGFTGVYTEASTEGGRSTIKATRTKSVAHSDPYVLVDSEWTVTQSDMETVHEPSATTTPSNSSQTTDPRREPSRERQTTMSEPLVASVRCGMCNAPCGDEEETKTHMEVAHGSTDTPFTCGVCSLVFPFKKCLLAHLKGQHWAPNQTCQICGKRFEVQRYLLTHLMRHAGVKKFPCSICGWRFFERHKLKFHLELHKAESERQLPYTCHLCGKKFANKASWSDHCNTHSGDRPFVCETCGACFSHRVGLRRHKVTHDKVKPFACHLCTRTFAVKPKLDQHMITHTGVSKHTCVHCSKVFTTSSSVKRHRAICPESGTAAKRDRGGDNPAHTPTTVPEAEESPAVEDVVYMCGDCKACFSTYAQAEQHTMMHRHQGSQLGPGLTEETENSSEVVSQEAATSTDLHFSEPASDQQVDDNTSTCFSDVSKTTSREDLFQTMQSIDVLDTLNQGIGSGVSNSSTTAPKQTVFSGENESAGTLSKLVRHEPDSSEVDSQQTLEAGAMSDSLYTVTVIQQETYTEKSVEFPTQKAENNWIKGEPHSGKTSPENHTCSDQVNHLRPADLRTEKGKVGEGASGMCEGGAGAGLPEGGRMKLAEMEEQTQLAANTLACLSSM